MILNLYWKDKEKKEYMLGKLYKEEGKYHFEINEEELKKATHKGCFGIGELNLLYKHHVSDKLFAFFKRRIPDIEGYDEMEILEKTNGILYTDRYYLKKASSIQE